MSDKTIATIYVERKILEQARSIPHFNISRACEKGLAETLKMPLPDYLLKDEKKDKITRVVEAMTEAQKTNLVAAMDRNTNFDKGQANLLTQMLGMPITKREVRAIYGRLKNPAKPPQP